MTVSAGGTEPGMNPNALMEILSSSDSIKARIEQFQAAKAEAELALSNLKIGKDARAAYDDADAKYNEALRIRDEAKTHSDAALNALSDASVKASTILHEAEAERTRVLADIAVQKVRHEEWLAATKQEHETKGLALDQALAEAAAAKQAHDDAAAAAEAARADAEQSAAKAKQAEADSKAQAAKLQSALANLTG